ncbi:nuclear transport factor 2 family protein [Granulicella sp. 5B5]|uniref:nuclear transport factor 2 family protein n=1 Tax=Granulicella sp. 5B5 TaxID=1617967 RepID=UPI002106FD2E|nr:nuclear transport factor 2 family protein [Granulicella sp. 5B5]
MIRPVRVRTACLMAMAVIAVLGVRGTVRAEGQAGSTAHEHKRTLHPKRAEREEVEALEHQWEKAMLAGDVATMDRLLSDDYLGVTITGDLLTKNQQLDRMRDRQLMMTKLQTTESRIKLIGHIAIVTSLAQISGQMDGKAVDGSFRYTRVYQRLSNGSWRITSFEATRVQPGYRLGQHPDSETGQE